MKYNQSIFYNTRLLVKPNELGISTYKAMSPSLNEVIVVGDDLQALRQPSRYLLFLPWKSGIPELLYLRPIEATDTLFEITDGWQDWITEKFKPYPHLTVYPYNSTIVRGITKTGKQSWTIQ